MSSYKLTIKLRQYTPLLHFQADTNGACLRASEVKPKLDRFVVDYLTRQKVTIPDEWHMNNMENDEEDSNPHTALRYKMRFEKCGEMDPEALKHPIHPLYFGNQGKDNKNKVKNVFYPDGIKMTVLVTVQKPLPREVIFPDGRVLQSMRDVLDALIPAFFELHCFGTRSNKGFGSFGVDEVSDKLSSIEVLNELKPACCQAVMELGRSDGNSSFYQQLNDIYVLSAMMKGGINYPHFKGQIQTALSNNIQSEKAYMKSSVFTAKEKEIYSKLCKKQNKSSIYQNTRIKPQYRFVRAMLGLTDAYSFGIKNKGAKEGEDYFTISVQDTEQDADKRIVRFPNPLCFKPGNGRLLLLIYQIPDKMYKHEFTFNNKPLKTPSENEFVLSEFVWSFFKILNSKRFRGDWARLKNGKVTLYKNTDYEEELNYTDTMDKLVVKNWGGIHHAF